MNNFSNHLKKFLSVLCIFSLSSISITNSKCFGAVTPPNFVIPTPTVTPNITIGGEPSNYSILFDAFRQLFPDQEPTQEQQTAMEETANRIRQNREDAVASEISRRNGAPQAEVPANRPVAVQAIPGGSEFEVNSIISDLFRRLLGGREVNRGTPENDALNRAINKTNEKRKKEYHFRCSSR